MAIAPSVQVILDAGLDIVATQDFDEVERLWPQTGRNKQSPMMCLSRHEFTQSNAFWLFLTEGGEAVGGIGVKYVDLVDEPFERYLRRISRIEYQRKTDPIKSIARPVLDRLGGKLIYMGELEFRAESRGRIPVLRALVTLAKVLAASEWEDFQWMYAFIPTEHMRFAAAYGFTYSLPNAITWNDPEPEGRLSSHWIIAMDRHSYLHTVTAKV